MRFEASYTPTPDDAVRFWRMHTKARGHVRLPFPEYVLAGTGVAALAVALVFSPPAGGLVLAFGCFYSAPLFYEWWLRLAANRRRSERITLIIDDEGVAISTADKPHRHGWAEVVKVLIDDWGVVCYGTWGFVYVPARAFAGGFQRDQLREFITRQIKRASPTN